ncbi:MAG: hypothetical protein KKD17_03605 [Nanoarchaeota archaeon]|nr:hypothetical protein [Nanoarchaeota archaeon]
MKRSIALVTMIAVMGCGSIAREYDMYEPDDDGGDAGADVYVPDATPDSSLDSSLPDADVDAGDGSPTDAGPDADVCSGGPLNFLNQQGIEYLLGDVLLNGDGSFEAESARGWYRNSNALNEYNVAPGNLVVFSRETADVPGMSGVTRILEYVGYDSTYNLVQFRDLSTGGMITGTVYHDGAYDAWDINVGGYTFGGTVDTATGRISPRLDSGDFADGREVLIHTAEGAKTMEELLCPDA